MPGIDAIANGYRAGAILLNANRLGLFDALGRDSLTSDELAGRLACDPRAIRIMADALAGLGVLAKEAGKYRNGEEAVACLLTDSPRSQRAILRHGARLYYRWGFLHDVARSGQPCQEPLPAGLEQNDREFALAMADVGRAGAVEAAGMLDLANVRTMLDAGGGPGLYSCACAQANPALRVTLMDGPDTLAVARENVAAAGLADRVTLQPGDIFTDPLGSGYDLILISNVVHIFSAERNAELVKRCAAALAPGGRLAIKDFILNDDRISPLPCALFAVNMLVHTDGGDCYTQGQLHDWFSAAGLTPSGDVPVATISRIVFATKPG